MSTKRSSNRRWAVVAAAGLGAGLTYWMQSDRDRMNDLLSRAVGKSAERIQKTISWFDEISSSKRRKIVDDNEELRAMNLVAQAAGESRADYDILQKSISHLGETMKFVQKVKTEQERRKIEAQKRQEKKLGEEKEVLFSEEEVDQDLVVQTCVVTETDSEVEEEEEVEGSFSEEEEEEKNTVENNLTVASIFDSGLQVMSGIFFGTRRIHT